MFRVKVACAACNGYHTHTHTFTRTDRARGVRRFQWCHPNPSHRQAKRATAEYSAVKEQLAGLKAEQKRVLRQQDELVDDLEELELERDELRVRLHHETTFGKANNAPPPVEAREPTKGKSRKAGKTHARGNGLAYPGDSSAGDDYYVDVSSEASSPPPTPPETPHESSLRVPRAGKDEGLLAVDWSAISGLVGVA